MQTHMKLNDDVTVGPQPAEADFAALAADGFKTVLNFRAPDESDLGLMPDAEGEIVRTHGMEYVNMPVSMDATSPHAVGPDGVDGFRDQFSQLKKPVFAHCRTGKRAGAMIMMHMAVENGMSGDETLGQAEQMGFACDVPELKQFVKGYVDSRQKVS